MADEHTERRRTWANILYQWNKEEKAENAAVFDAISSGWVETKMAKFLVFLWGNQIYACSMTSTRQKFDV